VLGHLYPGLMNLYGDRGNVICLEQRSRWRGIDFEVHAIEIGHRIDPGSIDILFIGGGQDQEQRQAAEDLSRRKRADLFAYLNDGGVALAVCGGYQLFGQYYKAGEGDVLPGAGVFDAWTEHPGPDDERCIGNVVAAVTPSVAPSMTLVGFENHGGRTSLGPEAIPLATVRSGFGNNGRDRTEGVVRGRAYGTYLHGSLLPKNPRFADLLLSQAMERRYGRGDLEPLDDRLVVAAHDAAVRRFG
jgi:CobQ-like glutamine amidotransferase family enzyme